MEPPSLNVLAIRKIAFRKGCTVERTVTLKQRPYVQIYDAKGRKVDGGNGGMALTLTAAKRLLEAMPDARKRESASARRPVPGRDVGLTLHDAQAQARVLVPTPSETKDIGRRPSRSRQ
jgi:hypothetical protein